MQALVCVQIGLSRIVEAYVDVYANNAAADCDVEKHFWIEKLAWEWLILPSRIKEENWKKKIIE